MADLEAAARSFESAGNDAGLGRVAHLRGTIAAQRGDYAQARDQYERSRALRVALGDGPGEASVISNLAIVAEYEQDYERAQELNEQAFALRSRLGDRWGIRVSRNNAGMVAYLRRDYTAACTLLEEALRIELEVGDLWMVAIANHNLGNATRELGQAVQALPTMPTPWPPMGSPVTAGLSAYFSRMWPSSPPATTPGPPCASSGRPRPCGRPSGHRESPLRKPSSRTGFAPSV